MKIEGPKGPAAAGKTDKAKKTGAVGTAFSDYLSTDEVGQTAAPAATAAVSMYAALAAAEYGTEREERRRAITHADDLLNDLEDLQMGLLLGSYTKKQLHNLASRLQQTRATVQDPQLLSLLDDIELRAAVELAKYGD